MTGRIFFTIWDFVKAHENFNDPDWDGEPEEPVIPTPTPSDPTGNPDDDDEDVTIDPLGPIEPIEKVEVKLADGKARTIQYIASTTYWSADGRPISATEFLEKLFGDLTSIIEDEDQLREVWSDPDNRKRFLGQLSDRGYNQDRLDDIRQLVDAPNSDLFDVLGYVLFTLAPKTRQERADGLREDGLSKFDAELKALLLGILQAYESHGENELASSKLRPYLIARYGSVNESRAKLGAPSVVREAYRRMQSELYAN